VLASGALVVDIRRADVAANSYIPGTLSLPLNKAFVGWAGWLIDYTRDIYLLSDDADDGAARAAAAELAMIGLDRVAGWFGAEGLHRMERVRTPVRQRGAGRRGHTAEWLRDDAITLVDVRPRLSGTRDTSGAINVRSGARRRPPPA
jgi:hypothetical protein